MYQNTRRKLNTHINKYWISIFMRILRCCNSVKIYEPHNSKESLNLWTYLRISNFNSKKERENRGCYTINSGFQISSLPECPEPEIHTSPRATYSIIPYISHLEDLQTRGISFISGYRVYVNTTPSETRGTAQQKVICIVMNIVGDATAA